MHDVINSRQNAKLIYTSSIFIVRWHKSSPNIIQKLGREKYADQTRWKSGYNLQLGGKTFYAEKWNNLTSHFGKIVKKNSKRCQLLSKTDYKAVDINMSDKTEREPTTIVNHQNKRRSFFYQRKHRCLSIQTCISYPISLRTTAMLTVCSCMASGNRLGTT